MSVQFEVSDQDNILDQKILDNIAETYQALLPDKSFLVEILFYSKPNIAQLNLRTRKIDQPTDVLSFPTDLLSSDEGKFFVSSEDIPLGSIVICPEKAEEYKESLADLIHHGMMHLMGYNHETDERGWLDFENNVIKIAGKNNLDIKRLPDGTNN